MPTLDQVDPSIYGKIELLPGPHDRRVQAPQQSAGPNAALVRLGLDEQRKAAVNSIFQQYGDDYDGAVKAVMKVDPELGLKLGGMVEEGRKAGAAKDLEVTKSSLAKIDLGVRALQVAAEQPDQWPTIRGQLLQQAGESAPMYDQVLPQPGDPQLQQKLTGLITGVALPTKQYLEVKAEAAQLYFDGKKVQGALTLMAGSKTPEQWTHTAETVKAGGLGRLLETYSTPEAAATALAEQAKTTPADDKLQSPEVEAIKQWTAEHGRVPTYAERLQIRKQFGQADDRPLKISVGAGTVAPTATLEDLAKGSGYSVEGLKKAARAYHESGMLPQLGMGGGKAKQAIQNAEALLFGSEGDIAMTGAGFKANAGALNALTKQLGAVQAYEQTSLGNLRMFTRLAKDIPDTGVPWLNTPIRALSTNLVGSQNMAAVNAARQVALTEIAKVVSNPNLTGALSDSAREEVLGLIPENATFAQIKRVAEVLEQDMARRPASMKKQIADIKYEMAHPGETAPADTAAAPAGSVKIGRFTVRPK